MGKVPEKTIISKYGSVEAYKEYIHKKLSGKHFYTNGVIDRKFADGEEIPIGWWRGRTNSGKGTRGYFFINNGVDQTQLPAGSVVPDGWIIGALPFTEEHKKKISKALIEYERTEDHNNALREAHQTDDYKNKIKQLNMERYGVECTFQLDDVRRKIKETLKRKYGTEFVSQSPEVRRKVNETCLEKYGVPWACMIPEVRMSGNNNSKPNKQFEKLLKAFGLKYEREFNISRFSYDFKVGNTLIEINPFATHNVAWSPYGGGVSKDYHLNKSLLAEQNGFHCVHIFDWVNILKVIDCIIMKDVKNVVVFREMGEGVYDIELNVSSNSKDSIIIEYVKKFIRTHSFSSIISCCDFSLYRRDIYSKLGFDLVECIEPRCHLYNKKSREHIISENNCEDERFIPIYDCGLYFYQYRGEEI